MKEIRPREAASLPAPTLFCQWGGPYVCSRIRSIGEGAVGRELPCVLKIGQNQDQRWRDSYKFHVFFPFPKSQWFQPTLPFKTCAICIHRHVLEVRRYNSWFVWIGFPNGLMFYRIRGLYRVGLEGSTIDPAPRRIYRPGVKCLLAPVYIRLDPPTIKGNVTYLDWIGWFWMLIRTDVVLIREGVGLDRMILFRQEHHEKIILVLHWPENSHWTLKNISHRQPL